MITGAQLTSVPVEQVRPAQSIVLDWHDGPNEGFLRLDHPPSTWYFRLYSETFDPEGLDLRELLLAPVPDNTMEILLEALRPLGAARSPHWVPIWQFPDEDSRRRADATIAELVGRAGTADVVVETRDLTRLTRMWSAPVPVVVRYPLEQRFPWVSHLLAAYLVGDDSFESEIDDFEPTEGPERTGQLLAELRRLLADPAIGEDELTTFVRTTSRWLDHTGRRTLEQIAARLERTHRG